jgi:superfamily II DNA or RNA helicase
MAAELRPYQVKCLEAMEGAAARGVTRQLVVSAVGTGKTTMLSGFLKRQGFPHTYGLMHRAELIKQARARFVEEKSDLRVGLDKAEVGPDFAKDDVVLATVQSVGRVEGARLVETPKDWPKVVFVDEAHHATQESYLAVLDHFGLYGDTPDRNKILVGLTATPGRLDGLGYDKIFDDVVFRYGMRDAIRDGWLADIRAWKIETNLDLTNVRVRDGEFVERISSSTSTPRPTTSSPPRSGQATAAGAAACSSA